MATTLSDEQIRSIQRWIAKHGDAGADMSLLVRRAAAWRYPRATGGCQSGSRYLVIAGTTEIQNLSEEEVNAMVVDFLATQPSGG
jgi:hypothetical protein